MSTYRMVKNKTYTRKIIKVASSNSLSVVIPIDMARDLNLKARDTVKVKRSRNKIIIKQ